MKAWFYLARTNKVWHSSWSFALDVDISFWIEERTMVVWKDPLSIAKVEKACSLLDRELRNSQQQLSGTISDMTKLITQVGRAIGDALGSGEYINSDHAEQRITDLEQLKCSAELMGDRVEGHALLGSELEVVMEDILERYGPEHLKKATQLASLLGLVRLSAAIGEKSQEASGNNWFKNKMWRKSASVMQCRRCGTEGIYLRISHCASCQQSCAYCEICLTMGRTRECGLLIRGVTHSSYTNRKPAGQLKSQDSPTTIEGEWSLSPAQTEAAGEALQFIRRKLYSSSGMNSAIDLVPAQDKRTFLLWAVTGAGKTEMIFPLIEEVVHSGGRVVIATPRKDVVLELAPRLAIAFPHTSLVVLYGGSLDRFKIGSITLTTTHQLLRSHEAFDLVLIDELDAYPYHNNPMLHFAAAKSRKQDGVTVLLSATPPRALMQQAAKGQLPHARVPVRYHLHALPMPKRIDVNPLSSWIRKGTIPSAVVTHLQQSINRGAQLFVFVPYVVDVKVLVGFLREQSSLLGLPPEMIEGTSSKDAIRGDKVTDFRGRTIRLLVTTTILERGVTVPKSDVFVIGADNSQFDCSALVQMAGRAGRSGDDPYGFVYFVGKYLTKSQSEAIHQIRQMNKVAKSKGYFTRQVGVK